MQRESAAAQCTPHFLSVERKRAEWPSKRKAFPIASEQLEELQCLPIALPSRGVAAFGVARRFDLLLLSAAALPIL